MELARFASSGGLVTIFSIGLLQLLMGLGLNPIVSLILTYSAGASLGYLLNRRFTFRSTSPSRETALPYFATYAGAIGINYSIFALATSLSDVSPKVAITISTVVAAGLTWFLLKAVVFRQAKESRDSTN